MPKRSYPYDDFSPLQLKTHIGVKELAAGSRQEELMKDVYEKTYEKLFTGARHMNDLNDNHTQVMPTSAACALDATSTFEPMQTLLDGTGYLVPPMTRTKPAPLSHCEGFTGLVDFGNTTAALRSQVPAAPLPAMSGQLCLDFNGHLTGPVPNAMDLDGDPVVTGNSDQSHASQPAAGAVGGLHRFGFKSSNQAGRAAGRADSQVCSTCGRLSGRHCCQFCERKVCQGCVRHCDTCNDYFCQLCSTLNYDAAMERAFCLGCAG